MVEKVDTDKVKGLIKIGVLVAILVFIISIIIPISGVQFANSFACPNRVLDNDNCSWGLTYNQDSQMSTAEILLWGNIVSFALISIILGIIFLAMKELGFFL
jgi:hypothetical protein